MTMITCVSPVNGEVYAERPALSLDAAKEVVARARKAQKDWARRPLEDRVQLVLKGAARLNEMADVVVPELAWQMGRPIKYGGEYRGFNERSNYVASIAADALAPLVVEDSANFARRIEREPHGVVFVIAPWNYPYMTAINTIAPALMAGNTVVLKHASQTLLVGERLVQAFVEVGVPADVFQNVFLDHETTSALIAAGSFNFVNFTGSVEGGRSIERAAAGTFTGLGLELGGKDPGYVMEDADLDAAVDTLMDGATFNSGQCCCGIERIYAHESVYEEFVERAVALTNSYRLGDPTRQDTNLGPVVSAKAASFIRGQVDEAVSQGARALIAAEHFAADQAGTPYLAPQILVDVDHSMRFMTEETFGPAVGIMKVKNDGQAIQLMNDSEYGLTAAIFSRDLAAAERIGDQVETGTVFLNRCDALDPALPWVGVKDTGRGHTLSRWGFETLTRPKSYHLRLAK